MMRWLLLLALVGCAPAPHTKAAGAVARLAVKPVAWNPANAPIAKVRAVADSGDLVVALGEEGASVLSANAVVARDESARGWTTAATLVAPDGTTPWIVGIDPAGNVHRLRGTTAFEDVTARYGLGDRKVRGATLAAPGKVAFLLDGRIALGSASTIAVYPTERLSTIAGGGDFVAGIAKDAIFLVNATNKVPTRFPLAGVTAATVDARGRLHATTERAVYAADASGALTLVLDAGHDGIHGLVASGDRVWFADRGELGVIEGDRVAETSGLGLGPRALLQRSSSGDVWVIDDGKLSRYAVEGARPPADASWSSTIGPVFARSCAKCHQYGGSSGVDLSTEKAWKTKAADVRTRVLVERTMPPTGHALADADRAAIATWLAAPR